MDDTKMRLEKWVLAGLRKMRPSASDAQLLMAMNAMFESANGDQRVIDSMWAELVQEFKKVGVNVSDLGRVSDPHEKV